MSIWIGDHDAAWMAADPDHELRQAAHEHAQYLTRAYDDLVPRAVLCSGSVTAP